MDLVQVSPISYFSSQINEAERYSFNSYLQSVSIIQESTVTLKLGLKVLIPTKPIFLHATRQYFRVMK